MISYDLITVLFFGSGDKWSSNIFFIVQLETFSGQNRQFVSEQIHLFKNLVLIVL